MKASRRGNNGKSPAGNSWSCTGAEWGSAGIKIKIKIKIMNDLTHSLRTEEGQAFAMICRHSGLDGYLRLFPSFPILGYSRNFEEFRGLGDKKGGSIFEMALPCSQVSQNFSGALLDGNVMAGGRADIYLTRPCSEVRAWARDWSGLCLAHQESQGLR